MVHSRCTFGACEFRASHRDALNSVALITEGTTTDVDCTFQPFGQDREWPANPSATDDKAYIGERKDPAAGLIYLNARTYDPDLFTQPVWFEVTTTGVGTNRFAYSFNDPVNLSDPEGNYIEAGLEAASITIGIASFNSNVENGNYIGATVDVITLAIDVFALGLPAAPGVTSAMVATSRKSARTRYTGFQDHHIAPKNLSGHRAIKLTRFDINSTENLIALPVSRRYHPTRTVHRGMHNRAYQRVWESFLDGIAKEIEEGKITPKEGLEAIERFRAEVRQSLRNGVIDLNRASEIELPKTASVAAGGDEQQNEDEDQ